jgi:hypothetical protein
MLDALQDLAAFNSQSSARLRGILEDLGIHTNNANGKANSSRGSAYFTAFHPMHTCLSIPPLTVRFFQDAVKFNVLTNAEAQEISFQMAACCRSLRKEYHGAFGDILNNGVFKELLSHELSLSEFLHKESLHAGALMPSPHHSHGL